MLADNGMSPRCLANLLQRLEDSGKEAAGAGGWQMCISPVIRQPRNASMCWAGRPVNEGFRLHGKDDGRPDIRPGRDAGTPGFARPAYFAENGVIL
jgi:hypothetical protein